MPRKIIIAIDGHSSCGKGTLAKNIAKELGYVFIDSGAMYRSVTLYLLRNDISLDTVKDNPEILKNINITFNFNVANQFYETHLNDENVEDEIRNMEVSNWVSQVSTIKEIRHFLVEQQRKIGQDKGVVMDGRDIGTIVFPDAELKIFMTAKPDIRATRRFEELQARGKDVDYNEVLLNIMERDRIDSSREESPLKKADDAITLDNTDMTKDQQAQVALTWAKGVIAALS
jgi:cytidylate kinase